jgi:hypothetical protein
MDKTSVVLSVFTVALICSIGAVIILTPIDENLRETGTIQTIDSTGDGYPDRVVADSDKLEEDKYNIIIELSYAESVEDQITEQKLNQIKAVYENREMKYSEGVNVVFIDRGAYTNEEYPTTDISELSLDKYEETLAQEQSLNNTCDTYHLVVTENVTSDNYGDTVVVTGIARGDVALVEMNPVFGQNESKESLKLPTFERLVLHEMGHWFGLGTDYDGVDEQSDWEDHESVMNYEQPCPLNEPYSSCQYNILQYTETEWSAIELALSKNSQKPQCSI